MEKHEPKSPQFPERGDIVNSTQSSRFQCFHEPKRLPRFDVRSLNLELKRVRMSRVQLRSRLVTSTIPCYLAHRWIAPLRNSLHSLLPCGRANKPLPFPSIDCASLASKVTQEDTPPQTFLTSNLFQQRLSIYIVWPFPKVTNNVRIQTGHFGQPFIPLR